MPLNTCRKLLGCCHHPQGNDLRGDCCSPFVCRSDADCRQGRCAPLFNDRLQATRDRERVHGMAFIQGGPEAVFGARTQQRSRRAPAASLVHHAQVRSFAPERPRIAILGHQNRRGAGRPVVRHRHLIERRVPCPFGPWGRPARPGHPSPPVHAIISSLRRVPQEAGMLAGFATSSGTFFLQRSVCARIA